MVLLTIVVTSNPHTIYFDHQIGKPSYIRLLSRSLYNAWNNLKKEGKMTLFDSQGEESDTKIFPPGYNTIQTLTKEFSDIFNNEAEAVVIITSTPVGQMVFQNYKSKKIYI